MATVGRRGLRELPRGARLTQFPVEWLEGMQDWCATRHCPYHMQVDAEILRGAWHGS